VYEPFYHSSGILTKAAFFEKPVIVSAGYCLEERVKKYALGVAVEPGNVPQITAAIAGLLGEQGARNRAGQPDYAGYRDVHSTGKLVPAFDALFQE
jgi:hypothetical protein